MFADLSELGIRIAADFVFSGASAEVMKLPQLHCLVGASVDLVLSGGPRDPSWRSDFLSPGNLPDVDEDSTHLPYPPSILGTCELP